MKKTLLIFLLFLGIIITISCSKIENGNNKTDKISEKENNKTDIYPHKNVDRIKLILRENKNGLKSPLCALDISQEQLDKRPIGIMYDNFPGARWQAGLSEADLVYEFLVEAPYTRYFALFQRNEPDNIGPVRSARPYFLTTAAQYDAIYVHCGGSEDAKAYIKRYNVPDIDGLYESEKVFFRKSHKKIPNNLYTSIPVLREVQERKKYRVEPEFEPLNFQSRDREIKGESANKISIQYYRDNSTEYTFRESEKDYIRYKDGKAHIDENDDSPIVAKNILILNAPIRVLDNSGRLEINLVSSGSGVYCTNGKHMKIDWEKISREGQMKYYDEDGKEIKLNPGVTWIQVVNKQTEINID